MAVDFLAVDLAADFLAPVFLDVALVRLIFAMVERVLFLAAARRLATSFGRGLSEVRRLAVFLPFEPLFPLSAVLRLVFELADLELEAFDLEAFDLPDFLALLAVVFFVAAVLALALLPEDFLLAEDDFLPVEEVLLEGLLIVVLAGVGCCWGSGAEENGDNNSESLISSTRSLMLLVTVSMRVG